jgi:hypothetical protein
MQKLINIVTSAPLLQSPDYNKPFTIATDASNVALGAVLSQEGKPVAFLSKTFSDRECNWDIYEKELFAVIYTIRKWEHYLQSNIPFTIITDNNAVSHFQTQKKLNAKQMRWITYLATFSFNIIHRPGTENKVADAISRKDIFGITITNDHWIEQLRQLSTKVVTKPWMTQRNGLFYKDNRLYIPGYPGIKKLIIEEIHQGMGGGHLGFKKTLEKVSRNYFWEHMANSIQHFVNSCDNCQRAKSSTQKPFGMLNPIPPPANKFDVYSLDFIGPLPKTEKGFDGILVIIDMFTKAATLEPITFTYGAIEIAEIFFKRIISRQGLPIKIISDRDPRFSGEFWKNLFQLIGTEVALSTAYHPQSDGQTERANRTLEEILRKQINATQDNWDSLLPMAEFAINDSVSESTRFSPFQLMYGMHPRKPLDMIKESRAPAADDFLNEMITAISRARENIVKTQLAMKEQADKHRREHSFKIGDQVMLSTKNLKLPSTHSRKLSPKWVGPFEIIRQKHKDSFELDLDGKFKIHPVFHVNLLKPWIDNNDTEFPDRHQDPPPTVIIDGEEEFEAEAIVKKRTRRGKTQYLVKWKGFHDEDNTWEPAEHLTNAPDLITDFDRKQSRQILMISTKPQGNSGRNSLKRGDGRQAGKHIQKSRKHPNMSHQHFCNHTKANITEEKVMSCQEENNFEAKIMDHATTIRKYSMKKFTQVISPKGEHLLAYEAYTRNIFYYRPGNMVFVEMHTDVCDCNMCEWCTKPPIPAPKKAPLRTIPYNKGRRTPSNTSRPGTTSPKAPTPERPPYSPLGSWRSSPEWDNLDNTCNWDDDPFKPTDEARELDPPIKNLDYWKDQLDRVIKRIETMSKIRNKICPGIPMHNHFSTIINTKNAYQKARRAEGILLQALSNEIPYSAAHQEWTLYNGQCEHGTKYFHASTICYNCMTVETSLDEGNDDNWSLADWANNDA